MRALLLPTTFEKAELSLDIVHRSSLIASSMQEPLVRSGITCQVGGREGRVSRSAEPLRTCSDLSGKKSPDILISRCELATVKLTRIVYCRYLLRKFMLLKFNIVSII